VAVDEAVHREFEHGAPALLFAAGAALGLAAAARSLFAPLVVVLAVWGLWRAPRRAGAAALVGVAVGLVPVVFFFVADSGAFVMGNLTYHQIREQRPDLVLNVVYVLCHLAVGLVRHPTTALLVWLAALGGVAVLRRTAEGLGRETFVPIGLLGAAYIAVNVTPFPVFWQYFVAPIVPFLVPFAAAGTVAVAAGGRRRLVALVLVALLAAALEGDGGAATMSAGARWRMASYRRVIAEVAARSGDGPVLSTWPGYVFGAGATFVPTLENHFAFRLAGRLSAAERARYHVPSPADVVAIIRERRVPLVVTGGWDDELRNAATPGEMHAFERWLDANYVRDFELEGVVIWRLKIPH